MLSLPPDLLLDFLLSLPPRDLCATLSTCHRIYNLSDDDKFYQNYWYRRVEKSEILRNYSLRPKWRYGTWRSLVAHTIIKINNLIKIISFIERCDNLISITLRTSNPRARVGKIYCGYRNSLSECPRGIVRGHQESLLELFVDLLLNNGDLINRHRKSGRIEPATAGEILFEMGHHNEKSVYFESCSISVNQTEIDTSYMCRKCYKNL